MSRQTDARLQALLKAASPPAAPTDRADAPRFTRAQVEWLERSYPPKCHDPSAETLAEHLQYAGRVGLVQELRAILEAQSDPDGTNEDPVYPEEAPIDWDDAERAGGDS